MKKYILIMLTATAFLAACNNNHPPKKDKAAGEKRSKIVKHYTCTMHPDVIVDKPGVCPKCGMDLVEKE